MVSIIKIRHESLGQFSFDEYGDKLIGLSNINVIIGSNNSGKSRLLRKLFDENSKLDYYTSEMLNSSLGKNALNDIRVGLKSIYQKYYSNRTSQYFTALDQFKNNPSNNNFVSYFKAVHDSRIEGTFFSGDLERRVQHALNTIEMNHENILKNLRSKTKYFKYYIPILRGLRPISNTVDVNSVRSFNHSDLYNHRTCNDYFDKLLTNVFTGLTIYKDILKLLTGNESDRALIRGFEDFISKEIFNKRTILIPNWSDETLHIKVGDEKQRAIFDLGDGLQTLITLLYPMYVNKDNQAQFFIEEPGIHLHPKLQRKLISCFKNEVFENIQLFLSSHSSIFINDKDVSLFVMERKDEKSFVRKISKESDKVGSLDHLGYRASDLFMSNYIIWVEGASDKIYIRKMISQKDSSLEEGKHYSFMQFSGTGYTDLFLNEHDSELKSVSSMNPNFGIIMDSDRSKASDNLDANRTKIVELFDRIGKFCWVTQLREIENYIPKERFEDAVGNVTGKIGLEIPTGDYDNRFKVVDPKQKESVRPTVRIEDDVFSKISAAHGSLKDISDKELRKTIQKSLDATKKSRVKIGKINLAKEVVKEDITFNEELEEKINELIDNIRKANL